MSESREPESASRAGALPPELMEALASAGRRHSVPKHTMVVVQGDPAQALYVILEGRVRVFVSDDDGRQAELNRLGPGEYFGELMLTSRRRTASVKTLTPCTLSRVDRATFESLVAARPDLASHLIQTLIERVRGLTGNVSSLALMDVYGRVARLLRESAETVDGVRCLPAMSQRAIAERVGASRSMINRIMNDLIDGQYIEVTRERIVLRRMLPRRW